MRQPETMGLDLREEKHTCPVTTVDEKRGRYDYCIVNG